MKLWVLYILLFEGAVQKVSPCTEFSDDELIKTVEHSTAENGDVGNTYKPCVRLYPRIRLRWNDAETW